MIRGLLLKLLLFCPISFLSAQHNIQGSYLQNYAGDHISLDFHTFVRNNWYIGGGVSYLNTRRYTWNNEKAFFQTRRPIGSYFQHFGLNAIALRYFSITDWKVSPFLAYSIHFTYAGAKAIHTEKTGFEPVPGKPEVRVVIEELDPFPTIHHYLALGIECPFSKKLALTLRGGWGFGISWNWDEDLEYFQWTDIDMKSTNSQNKYIEWGWLINLGLVYKLKK